MAQKILDGQYKIISALSGNVLSVNGGTPNDGTEVVQWQDSGQANQRWQVTHVAEEDGNLFYIIEHPGSGMVMEAPGPWGRGVPVVMRHYQHGGGDQRHREWKFDPAPEQPDVYKIVNRRHPFNSHNADYVIDVQDANPNWAPGDPTNIRMQQSWDFSGYDRPGSRQHWKLERLPET